MLVEDTYVLTNVWWWCRSRQVLVLFWYQRFVNKPFHTNFPDSVWYFSQVNISCRNSFQPNFYCKVLHLSHRNINFKACMKINMKGSVKNAWVSWTVWATEHFFLESEIQLKRDLMSKHLIWINLMFENIVADCNHLVDYCHYFRPYWQKKNWSNLNQCVLI